MKSLFYIIGLLSLLSSCSSKKTDFESQLVIVKNLFSDRELIDFKNEAEEDALYNIWATKGKLFKNTILKTNKGSFLLSYFSDQKIFDYDDITYVMLISLHRNLNDKNTNFSNQILLSKKNWMPFYNCLEQKKKIGASFYKKYLLGDTVNIYFPYDSINQTAVYYDCPLSAWVFDIKKDLIVKGTVVDKMIDKDSHYIFKIKVIGLNDPTKKILSAPVKQNDAIKINLEEVKIKPATD